MKRPYNAPGCFAISTVCEANKAYCRKCPVLDECRASAVRIMMNIVAETGEANPFAAILGVTPVPMAARTGSVDESELQLLTQLSGKALQVATTMCKRDINLPSFLQSNVNPFRLIKPRYMEFAFEFLLLSEEFTREEIHAFMQREKPIWTEATIRSHVSTALRIFEVFGCIRQVGQDRFVRSNYVT